MKVVRTIIGHLQLLSELAYIRFKAGGTAEARLTGSLRREIKSVRFPVAETADIEVEKS
jgi:hypothetical protein